MQDNHFISLNNEFSLFFLEILGVVGLRIDQNISCILSKYTIVTVYILRSRWYTHLRAGTRINEDLRNIVIDSVQTIFNAFVEHVFEYVSFENLYVKR